MIESQLLDARGGENVGFLGTWLISVEKCKRMWGQKCGVQLIRSGKTRTNLSGERIRFLVIDQAKPGKASGKKRGERGREREGGQMKGTDKFKRRGNRSFRVRFKSPRN